MTDFPTLIQHGNSWLFVPGAILLGALHGLEPGHSKTMMAAFIVAVRGTVFQAVLLGLAATLSHTIIVWVIALGGMYFGQQGDVEAAEPYLQILSAMLIAGVALWMISRTWRHRRGVGHGHHHHHDHDHDDVKRIDTGHGVVRLAVFEEGVPPRFRLFCETGHGHGWSQDQVGIETERVDGERQSFTFNQRAGFLESVQEIPEPHAFTARLRLGHGNHSHNYDVEFVEHAHHDHPIEEIASGIQDPHELVHANDIRRRFANREVTTGQIIVFGLTGGLIPCPASITVLLLCLQMKKIVLGAALVLCFSVGLALTMVLSGVLAALSVRHVSRRWSGFGAFAERAPYLSGVLILLLACYIGYQGVHALV